MKAGVKKVKRSQREKTKLRIRKRITGSDVKPRISVFKSDKYTYAQVISDESGKTILSVSTREKDVLDQLPSIKLEGVPNDSKSAKGSLAAAAAGKVLGDKIKAAGIEKVVFDRNGYRYHGRVKALADGVRLAGLNF